MRKRLSARLLRRLLEYDPKTGDLCWRERPVWMFADSSMGRAKTAKLWNRKFAGKAALGGLNRGYKRGRIFDKNFTAHRAAWVVHFGEYPDGEIDHINGDRTDNRICNLRSVSTLENQKNRQAPNTNKSGHVGVSWDRVRRKWHAFIGVSGRTVHLGHYISKEEAVSARARAQAQYAFHPNHGRA